MNILQMRKEDFFEIRQNLMHFWGDRHEFFAPLHHPMFIYEFGNTAYVIKDNNEIVAYLLGFLAQTSNTAYVHMIAVKPSHQKKEYGRSLYDHFLGYAKSKGCNKIRAITLPKNIASINFHRKIGMKLLGEKNADGINVVKDYSGPGQDMIVFEKEI